MKMKKTILLILVIVGCAVLSFNYFGTKGSDSERMDVRGELEGSSDTSNYSAEVVSAKNERLNVEKEKVIGSAKAKEECAYEKQILIAAEIESKNFNLKVDRLSQALIDKGAENDVAVDRAEVQAAVKEQLIKQISDQYVCGVAK